MEEVQRNEVINMAAKKKTEIKQENKITGTVFGGGLYIRKKPSTDAGIDGVLPNGTVIEILDTKDGWHKITRGYVMAKWVKLNA